MTKKTLAITIGDPAGIGQEIIQKALRSRALKELAHYLIIGSPKADIRPGRPTPQSARASIEYLDLAIELLKLKKADALVTAPVSKEGICSLGIPFQGHTEYLAKAFSIKQFEMMFVAPKLKVVLATRHIPIHRVSREITRKKLRASISLTHHALQSQFNIKNPRIGLCGLNPHAGEKGTIGKEELSTIIPAIQEAKKNGLKISGPLSADTLFHPSRTKNFDCIIAMYHDQGLAPIKALYFEKLVNLTIGLPFIRTSPAHGTAFDIAGKNKADPSSMIESIRLAATLPS